MSGWSCGDRPCSIRVVVQAARRFEYRVVGEQSSCVMSVVATFTMVVAVSVMSGAGAKGVLEVCWGGNGTTASQAKMVIRRKTLSYFLGLGKTAASPISPASPATHPTELVSTAQAHLSLHIKIYRYGNIYNLLCCSRVSEPPTSQPAT